MSGKHIQRRRTGNLRLNFFSTPTITTSYPTNKWVISSRTLKAPHATRCDARFYGQCDCACK
jgi:hypothetical protein